MRRETKIQFGAGGVLILSLAASLFLTGQISASASRHRLNYTTAAEEGAPPEVGLGIAMGAFRGLFVNFLWMRANQLKEDGKYYEAVDLASTITKLQPRFPRVWVFHAWNLAYNISVATQTREERWQWVRAGIDLLRDEAIPHNPNDPLLHKELAWIFLHKIQHIMDDANLYYKQRHALEWTLVVGSPPPGSFLNDTIEKRVAMLEPIQRAPDTLAELMQDPDAAALVRRIRSTTIAGRPLDLDTLLLQIYERARLLGRAMETTGGQFGLADLPPDFVSSINDPETAPDWDLVVAHVRKRLIEDKYHMEIDRMIRYTREHGPLDWRHPAAHSMYWSRRGVELALLRTNEANIRDYDFLNTDRIALHSAQELFRTGAIQFNLLTPIDEANQFAYMTFPNMAFVDEYENLINEVRKRNVVFDNDGNAVNMNERSWDMYSAGWENFIKDVIRTYYRRGDRAKAQEYLDKLIENPRTTVNNPHVDLRFAMTLDEFVTNEVLEGNRFTSPPVALQEISQSLLEAYLSAMRGDTETFHSAFNYARDFHALYTSKQVFNTGVNQGGPARMEIFSRHFDIVAGQMLAAMISNMVPTDSVVLYDAVPFDLRQRAYFFLEQNPSFLQWQADAVAAGEPEMFPEPPGMEEVRRDIRSRMQTDAPVGNLELQ